MFFMKLYPAALLAVAVLLLTPLAAGFAVADETVIEVSYSHRQVSDGQEPDPEIVEGSVITAMSANNPVFPVDPKSPLIQISPTEYQYVFPWDETEPRTFVFEDASHQIIEVTVFPESVYPFDPANHNLPVVAITTEPANLWDPDLGIYVWGNHDNFLQYGPEWERPALVDFYAADGSLIASHDSGVRINGLNSRYYKQKSLRLYFDHHGEPEYIDHDFFGSEPYGFRRLLLRTGRWPSRLLNDIFAQSIYQELGHLGSRYAYAVSYLNGEYWGVAAIRERIDEEYVEYTHDLDDAGYTLIKDGEELHGQDYEWWNLLDWIGEPHDYASHTFFQEVDRQIDLQSYVDWLLINIFLATGDNGFSPNLALLKPSDLKWRFIMWDEDLTMVADNLEANHFRFFSAADEQEYFTFRPPVFTIPLYTPDAQRYTTMFNRLLQNAEFRTLFATRAEQLLSGVLDPGALAARLDALAAGPLAEMTWHVERLGWNVNTYLSAIAEDQQWLSARHPIVVAQLADFMADHRADVELSRFEVATAGAQVQLRWRTEVEAGNQGFIVYRRSEGEATFTEIATYLTEDSLRGQGTTGLPTDYEYFDPAPAAGLVNHYRLSHVSGGGEEVVHDWVEMGWTSDWQGLKINEFMASNNSEIADETGQYEDWVEIYNATTEALCLDGLFLTDDLATPGKWAFPVVNIAAGDRLLIWCDDDEEDGSLHTSFKLSAAGEQIGICGLAATGYDLIDGYTFGPQTTDVSEGRLFDGGLPWVFFTWPTPGLPNPGTTAVPGPTPSTAAQLGCYPNPFNPRTSIHFRLDSSQRVALRIYDVAGRLVRTLLADGVLPAGRHVIPWDGTDDGNRSLASGAYTCRLTSNNQPSTARLILLR